MKRFSLLLLVLVELLSSIQLAKAHENKDVAMKFQQAILRKDNIVAHKCLADGVEIPEIRENSQIRSYQLVPSPKENVRVFLANFWDEGLGGERLAFIWKLTVKGEKITKIRTVYDGANPLMDEVKLVKEYQNKYRRRVFIPTEFPFKVTDFRGHIENEHERLLLNYRNEHLYGFLQIAIVPVSRGLESYKTDNDQYSALKNVTRILYRTKFDLGYEIRFQRDGLHYTVAIGYKKYLKKKFTVNDLIKIADSMK